jgi:hypothetical protein
MTLRSRLFALGADWKRSIAVILTNGPHPARLFVKQVT